MRNELLRKGVQGVKVVHSTAEKMGRKGVGGYGRVCTGRFCDCGPETQLIGFALHVQSQYQS